MNPLASAATFFGWASLINIVVLMFVVLAITLLRCPIAKLHGKLFGISEAELPALYFQYLANYKLLVIIFNIVPYIALKIML
jgi:hypothetical protein